MRGSTTCLVGVLAVFLVFIVSCGGGSSDPSGPATPANVGGVWTFNGTLTKNTCQMNAVSSIGGDITFYQADTVVETGVIYLALFEDETTWDFVYSGTVNGNNVSMAAVNPYVLQGGGEVIHFGSGIEVQNIEDNAGPGSLNLTGSCIQGCTGSCQTIWSGTWMKQ